MATAATPAGYVTIALEGIDGAGTSTQVPLLAAHLRGLGHRVACLAQPSKGPMGRMLRRFLAGALPLDPAAQALLFAADRLSQRQLLKLDPSAFRGRRGQTSTAADAAWVLLLDRDVLSSLAYQGVSLPQLWLRQLNQYCPPAELTMFFRLPPRVAAARRARRGGSAEAFDAAPVQRRVAQSYEQALPAYARRGKVVIIDAAAPLPAVSAAVRAAADAALRRAQSRRK